MKLDRKYIKYISKIKHQYGVRPKHANIHPLVHLINKSSPRDCKFSQAAYPMYISCMIELHITEIWRRVYTDMAKNAILLIFNRGSELWPRAILETIGHRPKCQIQKLSILHFDTSPDSVRLFVSEIWPKHVFDLSVIYDLDLWPKILQNNRLKTVVCRARSGLRTEPQTDR